MEYIYYTRAKGGYQLLEYYKTKVPFIPIDYTAKEVYWNDRLCRLKRIDEIWSYFTMFKDFWWNGSNFAEDTDSCMRGSCVHDGIYGAMLAGIIEKNDENKKKSDDLYCKMLEEDGMPFWRRCVRRWGLRTKWSDRALIEKEQEKIYAPAPPRETDTAETL